MWRDKTKFELWKAPEQSSLLDGLQFFEILPKDNKSWTHCPSQIWSDFPRVFNRCPATCSDCQCLLLLEKPMAMLRLPLKQRCRCPCQSCQLEICIWFCVTVLKFCRSNDMLFVFWHMWLTLLDHQNKLNKFGWFEVDGQVPVDALRTFLRSAVSQKFDVSWCLGPEFLVTASSLVIPETRPRKVPLRHLGTIFVVLSKNLEAKILQDFLVGNFGGENPLLGLVFTCLHFNDTPKKANLNDNLIFGKISPMCLLFR